MHLFFERQQWKVKNSFVAEVWQAPEEYSQAVLPMKILVGML
jgi:hypothetical protein